MKRRTCTALATGLMFSALSTGQARTLAEATQAGVLRLATSGDFAPFNSNVGGTLSGFEVELGNLLARQLNLKAVWSVQPFDGIFGGLNTDQYDVVLASHAINSTRLKLVDFARPHYCTGGVVLGRAGGPLNHLALKGKSVGIQAGTTYSAYVHKLPFPLFKQQFPGSDEAIRALAFGQINAVVTDRFTGLAAIKAFPKAPLVMGEQLWTEQIGMAVKKGNSTLQSALDRALATLLKDREYAVLSQKYFGQDIRC
jgi:polar amino acid transport system substrate-binding protein